ncbi:MAG TPA: S41 family peptidase [Candidatus Acidoferrales bacterium]|nr:S41 family peptidase [Candidatus Acidoferrales bacterium]
MRRKVFFVTLVLFLGTSIGFVAVKNSDTFYEVKQSIDLFGNVYKDVIENYVDPVSPGQFMRKGIDAMLSSLDPYTVYMDKQNSGEIDLLTTGKYGGIGVTIGTANGKVIITGVFDGYSAQRQGLRIGDQILMIDTSDVNKIKIDEVSDMVRGEPGSQLKLRIKREGEEKPFDVVLVRSEIRLKSVSYYGVVDSNIGFIKLDQFSRGSDEEVKNALTDLMARASLKGLILDLRNNPGGLLESAVNIVELFVPKGSLIVMTKGRDPSSDKKYTSDQDPIAPDIPMVVLVNGNSASASEIVTGALQDLDRAVIIGTNTFGKGLVQTILPLGYDAQLKMTTARYYTPSGRCIQKIDYERRRDGEDAVTPDSLRKEFKTLDGRPVYELGGISPDSTVTGLENSDYVQQLMRGGYFFNFATQFRAEHDSISQDFTARPEVLNSFKRFIEKNKFTYASSLDQAVGDARKLASTSNYDESIYKDLSSIADRVKSDEEGLFNKSSKEISEYLTAEIIGRFRGDAAQTEAALHYDHQTRVAESIIENTSTYRRILSLDY